MPSKSITIDDHDQKEELPTHVFMGASGDSGIKTMSKPRIGQPGELVVEQT